MPPGLGESEFKDYVARQKREGKHVSSEGAKKAMARQQAMRSVPVKQSRAQRASRNPELRKGHKVVRPGSVDDAKAVAGSKRRQAKKKAKTHSVNQKAVKASADAAADAAKKVDAKKAVTRGNIKKAALGAGVGLAAYGAYKMYKRRKAAQKNESIEDALLEIQELAETEFDTQFDDVELVYALIEAASQYDDENLLDDLDLYLSEEEEEREDSLKGLKSAGKVAAAGTVGELAATAAWNKVSSKKKRRKLLKAVGLGKKRRKMISRAVRSGAPAVAGATAIVGAAELARRALKRRREAKAKKDS